MDAFAWSRAAEDAAQMIADGDLSFNAICREVGVSLPTLRKWREHEDFSARVAELQAEYRESVRRRGIAVLENRVAGYNDRWRRMHAVIEARSVDPELAKAPGGDTGLVVLADWKTIGRGEDATSLPVYQVDTGLLREMRELEKQAAGDLGQWASKTEVTGAGGTPLLASIEAVIAKVYGTAPAEPEGGPRE